MLFRSAVSTGSANIAIGYSALGSTSTTTGNVAVGHLAGLYAGSGTTGNTGSDYSVYLGYGSRASAVNTDNEVVIGKNAIGQGANTITLGGPDHTAVVIPNDSQQLALGAAGISDSYIKYTGSLLEMYAVGGITSLSHLTIRPSGADADRKSVV